VSTKSGQHPVIGCAAAAAELWNVSRRKFHPSQMICPKCGDEYQSGFKRCSDCDVELVEVPPPPPESPPLRVVTVLSTGDPVRLEIAKSLLDSGGVDYWVKGEGLQSLFGAGRLGTGFNVAIGPMLLQVDEEDESDARVILSEIPLDAPDSPDS
jgi:Putative prokaryotic signal transducing protein